MRQISWYAMSHSERDELLDVLAERDRNWPTLMRNLNRHLGKPRNAFDLDDPIEFELYRFSLAAKMLLAGMDADKRKRMTR
jgi:hypothetical protein